MERRRYFSLKVHFKLFPQVFFEKRSAFLPVTMVHHSENNCTTLDSREIIPNNCAFIAFNKLLNDFAAALVFMAQSFRIVEIFMIKTTSEKERAEEEEQENYPR